MNKHVKSIFKFRIHSKSLKMGLRMCDYLSLYHICWHLLLKYYCNILDGECRNNYASEWMACKFSLTFIITGLRYEKLCFARLPCDPLARSTEIEWGDDFFESLWSKEKWQENGSGIFELSGKQGFQWAMPLCTKLFFSKNPYFLFFIFSMKNFDFFKTLFFKRTALYARKRRKRSFVKR